VDKDRPTLSAARNRLTNEFGSDRIHFAHGCFSSIPSHLAAAGFPPRVNGILLDLGVSSMQLDQASRGFSFRHDGPLDMRMDQTDASVPTAADIVNSMTLPELQRTFQDFGDEPLAGMAARLIAERRRKIGPIVTTRDLAECLLPLGAGRGSRSARGSPRKRGARPGSKRHPATRCFQALRIAVNGELDALTRVLSSCAREESCMLQPGGRLAIISFHSLEDRPTKQWFRRLAGSFSEGEACGVGWKMVRRKPVVPSSEELQANPRARSARLRALERAV
jgi:16S rRNA (cytosine1402-N4)-methyltransferase